MAEDIAKETKEKKTKATRQKAQTKAKAAEVPAAETPAEEAAVQEEQVTESAGEKKSAGPSRARTFVNKRDMIRIGRQAPERVMSERKKASAALLNSKTQNQPMPVTITGIEPIRKKDGSSIMMPVSMYYDWKIVIPRQEFLDASMLYIQDENGSAVDRRIMTSIGAEVDIVPTNFIVDPEKPDLRLCVASRLKAMEIRKEEMWFAKNIVGSNTDYLLVPGKYAEARVVGVVKGAVFIELFGVESVVRSKDVSYSRIENCKSKFKPGDKTRIVIKNVNRDEETKEVSFEASIKEAYPDPRKAAFKRYVKGGVYNGVVTMIGTDPEKDSRSYAFVKLDNSDVDVYCAYPRIVLPQIGDRVTITITEKREDQLRMWGKIEHVDIQENN